MTSTFILAPGEEFIQCPYNTAHQITNARFLTHLDKCRKAYIKELSSDARSRRTYLKICRHNALHHVPAPELRFHEERCVDAFSVVRHMAYHNSDEANRKYEERRKQETEWKEVESRGSHSSSKKYSSSSSKHRTETKSVSSSANEWGLEEEDWESECVGDTPGYDPEVKLKSEVVIYNPHGLTKSERKKFRNEVRHKAAEISLKGEPVELPTATTFDVKPDITDLRIKDEPDKSPREPGEIDDDDDDNVCNEGNSRSSDRDRDRNHSSTDNHSRRNSRDNLSSTSSRQHHSHFYSKSSSSRADSYWTDSVERTKEDYYPDSDDFEGIDPFA